MSAVNNTTAKQFNLKCVSNGSRVLVRIAPGFNIIENSHWEAFVSKDGKKVDPYVAEIKKKGFIEFGPKIDDMELDKDADTKAKSKSEPLLKLKAQAEQAEAATKVAEESAVKAKAETEKAVAEAEKAKLELQQLKDKIAKK